MDLAILLSPGNVEKRLERGRDHFGTAAVAGRFPTSDQFPRDDAISPLRRVEFDNKLVFPFMNKVGLLQYSCASTVQGHAALALLSIGRVGIRIAAAADGDRLALGK